MAERKSRFKIASAFDIRTIIGALLGIYGVILTFLGIFNASDAELEKADGFNVNLVNGLILLGVACLFILWAVLRPLVVEEVPPEALEDHEPERR
jgi:drug/metabolite transporter (DMT)-like permease